MFVPQMILKQLYTKNSLKNVNNGVVFSIKNRLKDVVIQEISKISVDKKEVPLEDVEIDKGNGSLLTPSDINKMKSFYFPLRKNLNLKIKGIQLEKGKHQVCIKFKIENLGALEVKAEDIVDSNDDGLLKIPRNEEDDYQWPIIKERQGFVESYTKRGYEHIFKYSIDPALTKGNIENFIGAIQVPLGVAGPIKVNGENAQGEFLVPLATSEGTLVASYNRGIKVANLCGGIKSTVVQDMMQRAPVFIFDDAREARDFVNWVNENIQPIREQAESTSNVAKLIYIDPYLSNKFAYLRFNFSTGDAAGQNMVGRATFRACGWILDQYKRGSIKNFYLESNLATDKKASQINVMRNRGKRVTAEAVIKREVLVKYMRVEPEQLNYHSNVSNIGAFLSGANNNGAHSPNAITAMFIATGQDVANVAESSAAIFYSELTKEGDLYLSLTIPSLIVATYGGGTGLQCQRECLEMMDCYGKGKVNKFAEIVAAVALAGEISLGSAISSSDWVSSHETYGRNR